MDSLVQSAGRINRRKDGKHNTPAIVEVFEISDYRPYNPELILETRKVLSLYQTIPESSYKEALNEYWLNISSIFDRKLNLAERIYKKTSERGIFSLNADDWKDIYKLSGIREGIATVPVVPLRFHEEVLNLTKQYRGLILTRKVFQYMVNIPLYMCLEYCPEKPLINTHPWINFIDLKYSQEIGLHDSYPDK